MPSGLKRYHHTGQSHFVTFCCYHRRPLFTTDASRRVFENALECVRRSFRLRVYGYVVMPEHIHLLVSEPERTAPLKPKSGLSGPPSRPLKIEVRAWPTQRDVRCVGNWKDSSPGFRASVPPISTFPVRPTPGLSGPPFMQTCVNFESFAALGSGLCQHCSYLRSHSRQPLMRPIEIPENRAG
jgi:REP element-mobilizing transposase RayT